MRCRTLLVLIAAVVALPGLPGRAQPPTRLAPALTDVTKIKRLIRQNTNNTEIVSFSDRGQHPVRVVRGKPPSSGASAGYGASAIIIGTMQQTMPLRIPLGEPAPVAVAATAPIGAFVQVVTFNNRVREGVTVLRGSVLSVPANRDPPALASGSDLDLFHMGNGADLDRVAFAVDGAESSHGTDPGMWRPDASGPQGPMQVSAAAASDSGGGDRFDLMQNRRLGRAYLSRLFERYGNWSDTVAAYNWGPGNMDAWIAQGRPAPEFPLEVARYRERVLRDGGIRGGPGSPLSRTDWRISIP
jgi:hypothetical protein